ncbi:MAG: F0F1 ATP synthase subunit A [Candidatus Moranbacteria bacterium]|nr:F0F1 ATP synthase subunit A [Candidatus Moranbacteria bacterium]
MSTENANNSEIQTESTLFAEPILHVGNFTITNSLVMSWITVAILVTFFVAVGKKSSKKTKKMSGVQNIFEILLEQALNLADSVTGSRKKTGKFLPVVLSLFLFILVNNWLGLLPGVGTIGFVETGAHGKVFIPFLRGATADLNTTLAISLFAVILSHILGVVWVGAWNHFNKFFNIKAFLQIFKKGRKEPILIMVNPIKAFVGLIEVVGEIAKIASLSLRLFGNIFAGEVLLASMMAISAFLLPIPFMFLELIVGIVQALVFAILTLAFMSIATTAEEH